METLIILILWCTLEIWYAIKKNRLKREEQKLQEELELYLANSLEKMRNKKPFPKLDYSDFERMPTKE